MIAERAVLTALVLFWMLSYVVQVLYKENIGKGIPIPITPEMERVKHNQENFSSVFKKQTNKKPFTVSRIWKLGYFLKPSDCHFLKALSHSTTETRTQ